MYVVAGASGNTGSVVASELLSRSADVRVIARNPSRVAALAAKGAEVRAHPLDDVAKLTESLRGAKGAYLLLPPQMQSNDPLGDNRKRLHGYVRAIDESGVNHVVFLSSIGAQHRSGTGPVVSGYDAEALLGKVAAAVTFLRACSFVENLANSFSALDKGVLPTFLRPDAVFPMVPAVDIGKAAAAALLEGSRDGQKTCLELSGARDVSMNDVAATLTTLLGRHVQVQQGAEGTMIPALTAAGLNPYWAHLYKEMTYALNTGHIAFEGGKAIAIRGTTPLETSLAKLLHEASQGKPAKH